MRTISSSLQSAQEAASQTPYIRLVFHHGGTSHNYSDRKKLIEHHEEPYNDYATILLGNHDREVVDLTGYYVDIVYGADGEGVATARLWVKAQSEISVEGQLAVVLSLEGAWSLMGEQLLRIGSPPLYNDQPYTTSTVYGILENLIESELATATGYSFILNVLGDQDDGIIDTFIPQFSPNQVKFDDFNTLIQTLMAMTKCYLRAKAGLDFEVVHPEEGDSTDETYYSYQAYYFLEYVEQRNITIPNHVIVFCNQVEGVWVVESIITGVAQDSSQINSYMEVIGLFTAPTITTQGDANDRASAILSKLQAEIVAGRLVIPHDCRVELYDRVRVYDTRGT